MSWAIGFDATRNRDIGYGVPAWCDHPGCERVIDRGLAYVCCGEPHGGDGGCGLYFCAEHGGGWHCERCQKSGAVPFTPKPDHPDWIKHKLTDESWAVWRAENPKEVTAMRGAC